MLVERKTEYRVDLDERPLRRLGKTHREHELVDRVRDERALGAAMCDEVAFEVTVERVVECRILLAAAGTPARRIARRREPDGERSVASVAREPAAVDVRGASVARLVEIGTAVHDETEVAGAANAAQEHRRDRM